MLLLCYFFIGISSITVELGLGLLKVPQPFLSHNVTLCHKRQKSNHLAQALLMAVLPLAPLPLHPPPVLTWICRVFAVPRVRVLVRATVDHLSNIFLVVKPASVSLGGSALSPSSHIHEEPIMAPLLTSSPCWNASIPDLKLPISAVES